MKRVLRNLLSKTGPFKVEEDVVEKWYTSINNASKAYSLLFLLYIDPSKMQSINGVSDEEVWQSHPRFQLYGFEKFKTYSRNMKKLTYKRKRLIDDEEAGYLQDILKLPKNEKNMLRSPLLEHSSSIRVACRG